MGRGGAGFGACCIVLRCGGGVILSCRDRILYCSQERSISLLLPSHYYCTKLQWISLCYTIYMHITELKGSEVNDKLK